eukprot:CAMPEP_0181191290 /NCGR_PEP_ID=MMETSP1096-20121128/12657_1 /TAXON_ID=156174 ORGANISM="Chrysochromulina ericina, Strain CCMP281" /NCGR_SAMPLE_ID=MMETSP1096 /ASSEMBLY_ACC=CAM_ASM_000453 /LENGTH=52 /DNA_ID=CAMNT_0023280581 /DNA_START=237 /DNA_END=395 /DNA_ORIENTATION=+
MIWVIVGCVGVLIVGAAGVILPRLLWKEKKEVAATIVITSTQKEGYESTSSC